MKHLILTMIVLFQTSALALDRVGGPIGIPEFAKVPVPQEKLELLQLVTLSEAAVANMHSIRQRGLVFTSASTQATEWGDVIYNLKFDSLEHRCGKAEFNLIIKGDIRVMAARDFEPIATPVVYNLCF